MEINEDLTFELQKLKSDEIIKDNAVEKLATLLIDAVDERVDDKVAIAFSGGIDSSLIAFICDKLDKDFTLYTVGFADSKDVLAAQTLADEMDWTLKVRIITIDEVEAIIKKVIEITGKKELEKKNFILLEKIMKKRKKETKRERGVVLWTFTLTSFDIY